MGAGCGADCSVCGFGKQSACRGCEESCGCPFGKPCFIANYIKTGGRENYNAFLARLTEEINALGIPGLPEIRELTPLNGVYVNLAYPLPNGGTACFLDDRSIYLGTQVPSPFNDGTLERFFGVVADMDFILVSEYGANGADPVLITYQKR